jgi:tetratricopeptide (TPR) repeat protein
MKFKKLKSTLLLLSIVLMLPMLSFGADEAQALFLKGNGYYAKSQYKEALAAYKQLLDEGYESAPLYFNLGNASFKTDDVPSALLYYEKARKLAPGDEDINANIRFANLKTTDKIDEVPEFFLSKWWKAVILSFSANFLSVLSIVFVLLGSVILILYFFAGSVSVKKSFFYVAVAFFIAGTLTIFTAGMQVSYFNSHRQAIIFSNSVTVKSGPVEKSGSLFVLHEGTKVNILDNTNDWIKIRLGNGNEGWIKGAEVKEI